MRIKLHYQRIIRDLMKDNGISPASDSPGYVVMRDAGYTEVVQHTDYYVGKGNDTRLGNQRHYRYGRYRDVLWRHVKATEGRKAHVDIGCGAGLFSWVFLDLARRHVGLDRVDLYGLDHNQAMIRFAHDIRSRLLQDIPDYPELHYSCDSELLMGKLIDNYRRGTDYTITLGHVLVQAQAPGDIDTFTQVIAHILDLMDARSNCLMVAVDALHRSHEFAEGWNALLESLASANIRIEEVSRRGTAINEGSRPKIATLHPAT